MTEIRSCLSNAEIVYTCPECGFDGIFKSEVCARCDSVLNQEIGGKELNLEMDCVEGVHEQFRD